MDLAAVGRESRARRDAVPGTRLLLDRTAKELFVLCHRPTSVAEFDAEVDILTRELFRGAWMSALFVHYEVEPVRLQAGVPFPLDVRDGKAYVSVVAFSQERLRLRFAFGGVTLRRCSGQANWVGRCFANHEFLNVRTYVCRESESGIFFLAEWVPKWVTTWIAGPMFGLPYRFGRLEYQYGDRVVRGCVRDSGTRFRCRFERDGTKHPVPCERGSLDEFLLERYVAFTEWRGRRRMFRVEHEPWPQTRVEVTIEDESLLRQRFGWWSEACMVGANFSPGVRAVTIGRPRLVRTME